MNIPDWSLPLWCIGLAAWSWLMFKVGAFAASQDEAGVKRNG